MPDVSGRFAWPVRRRTPGPEGTAEDIAVQDVAEREAADRQLPPPDPEPMADPPPRLNLAAVRLGALGLALVLALALGLIGLVAVGPPSVAQLRAEAGVDSWKVLPIGVKDDQPGVAYREESGRWTGFDIDIAYMIAEDLGFRRADVRFYGIESEDRARMQATDPQGKRVPVKLVIASYSITKERLADGVGFAKAPYLLTEQSVVTRHGKHRSVSTLADLHGEKVCSLSASTSAGRLDGGVTKLSRNKISECFADLRKGTVQAVSTDAAILAGFMQKYPGEFDHWDIGDDDVERWGVNAGDNTALRTLVELTFYRSYQDPRDSRWERAYRDNLQIEVASNGKVPIAVGEQPRAERPAVRELPWEDVTGD